MIDYISCKKIFPAQRLFWHGTFAFSEVSEQAELLDCEVILAGTC